MDKVTLYKKDARGKLRVWAIRKCGDSLMIGSGLADGEIVETFEDVDFGKAGRDIDEQIESRMQSRINKKLDKGYIEDKEKAIALETNLNALGCPRPMLAHKFKDRKKESLDNINVQWKFDGLRCLIHNKNGKLIAYSRNGKIINSIDHILEYIDIKEGVTLDGELYCHGIKLQRISSWVRRTQEDSKKLVYVCYDMVSQQRFLVRYLLLKQFKLGKNVQIAMTEHNIKEEDFPEHFKLAKKLGYEGLIIRVGGGGYEDGKRSYSLLKLKAVDDDEFEVIDIISSADGWGRLVCVTKSGKTFKVSAPGTMGDKIKVLRQRKDYIGKFIRVEYANLTKDGIPFHPVAIMWRDKYEE